jgi:hypothetical protein
MPTGISDSGNAATAQMTTGVSNAEIETFIAMHQLDERVSAILLSLPPDQQRYVLDSPMDAARNTSALVWSRIRTVQQGGANTSRGVKRSRETDYAVHGLPSLATLQNPFALSQQSHMLMHGLSALELPAGPAQPQSHIMMPAPSGMDMSAAINAEVARLQALIATAQAQQAAQAGQYASILGLPMQTPAQLPTQLQDVEAYIKNNGLDERVSKYLRELPPAKQQASLPDNHY